MKTKKILIRCDSSKLIGIGHVMRCLNLAERLRDHGHDLLFVCRDLKNNIAQFIEKRQFKTIILKAPELNLDFPQPEDKWLEVPLTQELEEINSIITHYKPDWVIVDHYAIGTEWEMNVSSFGCKILAIDDTFRRHIVDSILDQNFQSDHYSKWLETKTSARSYYLGPRYCLLSKKYKKDLRNLKPIDEKAKNILGFFGGSDPAKMSELFIEACKLLHEEDFIFTLIIGPANERRFEIEEKANSAKVNTIYATDDMYSLLQDSDLYVGAGGSTNWERCFLGLPALIISGGNNQIELAKNLAKIGSCSYLGKHEDIEPSFLAKEMKSLGNDKLKRISQRENSLKLEVSEGLEEVISSF